MQLDQLLVPSFVMPAALTKRNCEPTFLAVPSPHLVSV